MNYKTVAGTTVISADWCDECLRLSKESGAYYPGDDRPASKHPIAYAKIRQEFCDCYKRAQEHNLR